MERTNFQQAKRLFGVLRPAMLAAAWLAGMWLADGWLAVPLAEAQQLVPEELRALQARRDSARTYNGSEARAGLARLLAPVAPHVSLDLGTAASTAGSLPFWHHSLRAGLLAPDTRPGYADPRLEAVPLPENRFTTSTVSGTRPGVFGNAMADDLLPHPTHLFGRLLAHVPFDTTRLLQHELLVDAAIRARPSPDLLLTQAYAALRLGPLQLRAGRFHETMRLEQTSVTSGSLGFSGNARPIPQVDAGMPDWWNLPGTFGFIQIKGNLSHGWLNPERPLQSAYLHKKMGFALIGGPSPVKIAGGAVHTALWGGYDPGYGAYPTGWDEYWKVFWVTGGTDDAPLGEDNYFLGDQRGYYNFGLYGEHPVWHLHLYKHILVDDKDGVKFKAFRDGIWGLSGVREQAPSDRWRSRFPAWWPVVEGFSYEYLYSKYQNGDNPPEINGGRGEVVGSGWDDYYTNYRYLEGWSYLGQTIGSPLFFTYFSPAARGMDISVNNYRLVANNRIVAHHVGLEGVLPGRRAGAGSKAGVDGKTRMDAQAGTGSKTGMDAQAIPFRFMATWSRNYGTYRGRRRSELVEQPYPLQEGPWSLSLLFEADVPLERIVEGVRGSGVEGGGGAPRTGGEAGAGHRGAGIPGSGPVVLVSAAADFGELFPRSFGLLLSLRWVLN